MNKFLAILQLIGAGLLVLMTAATVVNLILIAMLRSETVSVVNTIIGQGVLAVCLAALAQILYRKGLKQLKQVSESSEKPDSTPR